MSPDLKMKIIAENAKLDYMSSVFTSEISKETADLVAIKRKFDDMYCQLVYVLKPLIDEINQ
jgi:hypothetical protein